MGGGGDKNLFDIESFEEEEFDSRQITKKLQNAGLNSLEISLLASSSENLKKILDEVGGINNLIKISPSYKVRQVLNVTRKELERLKNHVHKLEKSQEDITKLKNKILQLQAELAAKHQVVADQNSAIDNQNEVIESLNKQMSDIKALNEHLEIQLKTYPRNRTILPEYYTDKARERYYSVTESDFEHLEIRRKNQELIQELLEYKNESKELKEQLDLTKQNLSEKAREIEKYYNNKIVKLKEEVDGAVSKKQKEWDSYYKQLNEQHRKELLTLQSRHDEKIIKLNREIKKITIELEQSKIYKNPILGLLKKGFVKDRDKTIQEEIEF